MRQLAAAAAAQGNRRGPMPCRLFDSRADLEVRAVEARSGVSAQPVRRGRRLWRGCGAEWAEGCKEPCRPRQIVTVPRSGLRPGNTISGVESAPRNMAAPPAPPTRCRNLAIVRRFHTFIPPRRHRGRSLSRSSPVALCSCHFRFRGLKPRNQRPAAQRTSALRRRVRSTGALLELLLLSLARTWCDADLLLEVEVVFAHKDAGLPVCSLTDAH
jgi:hypothetical protein